MNQTQMFINANMLKHIANARGSGLAPFIFNTDTPV